MKCSYVRENNIKSICESIVLVCKKLLKRRNDEDVVEQRWINVQNVATVCMRCVPLPMNVAQSEKSISVFFVQTQLCLYKGESVKIARWRRDKRKIMYLAS